MTTREQANADALWPNGTDVDGVRSMGYGVLAGLMHTLSIYVGTANARGMLMECYDDLAFWRKVSETAPAVREALRVSDAMGAELDRKEREAGKQ